MNKSFSRIYEMVFKSGTFSDDLYQEGLYAQLGIIAIIIAVVLTALFYYVINRPSFSRWYHWLMIMAACFAINYGIGVVIPKNKFSSLNIVYGGEYWVFAIFNALIGCFFYIIISFLIRWWSRNCKGTPIPN